MKESFDDLAQASSGAPPGCWAAIKSLGHSGDTRAEMALLALARGGDAHKRRAALEALAVRCRSEEFITLVERSLRDGEGAIKRTACDAAVTAGLGRLAGALESLLNDPEHETVISSCNALGRLGSRASFARLSRLFSVANDDGVRKAAGFALHSLVSPDTVKSAYDLFVSDPLPRHRQWACELSGRLSRSEEIIRDLEKLSIDPDGHVRDAAKAALSR